MSDTHPPLHWTRSKLPPGRSCSRRHGVERTGLWLHFQSELPGSELRIAMSGLQPKAGNAGCGFPSRLSSTGVYAEMWAIQCYSSPELITKHHGAKLKCTPALDLVVVKNTWPKSLKPFAKTQRSAEAQCHNAPLNDILWNVLRNHTSVILNLL